MLSGAGPDSVLAAGGDDVIVAGRGDDKLHPGQGRDTVFAGRGDDVVFILDTCELEPFEFLLGGRGHDTLISPLSRRELLDRGVFALEFEEVIVTDSFSESTSCRQDLATRIGDFVRRRRALLGPKRLGCACEARARTARAPCPARRLRRRAGDLEHDERVERERGRSRGERHRR